MDTSAAKRNGWSLKPRTSQRSSRGIPPPHQLSCNRSMRTRRPIPRNSSRRHLPPSGNKNISPVISGDSREKEKGNKIMRRFCWDVLRGASCKPAPPPTPKWGAQVCQVRFRAHCFPAYRADAASGRINGVPNASETSSGSRRILARYYLASRRRLPAHIDTSRDAKRLHACVPDKVGQPIDLPDDECQGKFFWAQTATANGARTPLP